jgi:hypothetical protein
MDAKQLYIRYQEHFYTHIAGWGGFREYPRGIDRAMDIDSGPIVFGMGVAATGIGLGAARLFGDRRAYISIMRTATSVGLPPLSWGKRRHILAPLLGEAILFHGVTARMWSANSVQTLIQSEAPFPLGALILTTLLLALLVFTAIKLKRTASLLWDNR